eukprot:TRINITY_DN4779_c0_g1_i1.p1 TRINITY_DN4779_c0_g1~~TRINITY_DN4779_c0_g1_i1.p1  ORF type:complete len:356 (-),score=60.93 TRINITY_DN4779_c0_g1_i1:41-1108(-)
MSIEIIASDQWRDVFSHLDVYQLRTAACVCQLWRSIINDPEIWRRRGVRSGVDLSKFRLERKSVSQVLPPITTFLAAMQKDKPTLQCLVEHDGKILCGLGFSDSIKALDSTGKSQTWVMLEQGKKLNCHHLGVGWNNRVYAAIENLPTAVIEGRQITRHITRGGPFNVKGFCRTANQFVILYHTNNGSNGEDEDNFHEGLEDGETILEDDFICSAGKEVVVHGECESNSIQISDLAAPNTYSASLQPADQCFSAIRWNDKLLLGSTGKILIFNFIDNKVTSDLPDGQWKTPQEKPVTQLLIHNGILYAANEQLTVWDIGGKLLKTVDNVRIACMCSGFGGVAIGTSNGEVHLYCE